MKSTKIEMLKQILVLFNNFLYNFKNEFNHSKLTNLDELHVHHVKHGDEVVQ